MAGNETTPAGTLREYYDQFSWALEYGSDKRVKGWFLMSSPVPTTVACIAYVLFMKWIGPRLMRDREPLQLKNLMVAYNIFQILFNVFILSLGIDSWLFEYSLTCQPVDYSLRPRAVRMVHAAWWFYFSKFVDWFDTLFFILRKKFDQVSLLHIVHHGIMPFSCWFGVKFTPGGHSTFFGLLNTQVHIIMYLYYTLAALGPKYRKYLWWKQHLTTIQMATVFVHAVQLLFVECDYPKVFVYVLMSHAIMFTFLFLDFYKKSYMHQDKRKAQRVSNGVPVPIKSSSEENSRGKKDGKNEKGANGITNGIHHNDEGLRKRATVKTVSQDISQVVNTESGKEESEATSLRAKVPSLAKQILSFNPGICFPVIHDASDH
ncbi:unnamed protein product [Darwinula stevensoni]|uniref:Elongation of very long chain fatty acids protein n=1 Tax=Darwinula stevensoni TaxID=69355 RepID=A0A7R9FSA2_9CRUS|nr:unnamed protein product [Darwinula stevensoni]CAG0903351.1 unnamed protein product [Darwinula stevensoni]